MAGEFIGELITSWDPEGFREMKLIRDFSFIDFSGKMWTAPAGAILNGATIPKPLWSTVGAPYVGKYRRASVIHDYFIGEGGNPDVSRRERRKADRMFYEGCLTDGCSKKFARILYWGVSLGTWAAINNFIGYNGIYGTEEVLEGPDDHMIKLEFDKFLASHEHIFSESEFEEFEDAIDEQLEIYRIT